MDDLFVFHRHGEGLANGSLVEITDCSNQSGQEDQIQVTFKVTTCEGLVFFFLVDLQHVTDVVNIC